MRISVVGLGYVGAVTAACLARDGHQVLGVDSDPSKVGLLRTGKTPIVEPKIGEITQTAVASGRLLTTERVDQSCVEADLIFVCVGTPSAPNGSQDLGALRRVAEELGRAIGGQHSRPVVVIRSTVPPGTTRGVVLPILEATSGKSLGEGFGLCFQPEFLREGSSVDDFYAPPFTVVGGGADDIANVRTLFREFDGEFVATDIESAEFLKLVCNSFHALKVTFANEVGRLGRSQGLDPRVVMKLMCMDHRLNISEAYLRPGFAFGGSCLPKDLRALLHIAKSHDVETPLLGGILPSNQLHVDRALDLVVSGKQRKVGLIGLSFKQGTDDLRESPLVALAERLIGKGYDLRVFDSAVSIAMLLGSNRKYIHDTIPHIGTLLQDELDTLCSHASTLVVAHKDDRILAALDRHRGSFARVVDLVGIPPEAVAPAEYVGICW